MALSFPLTPTAGQQYVGDGVTYEWDNTLGAWVKLKPVQSALLGAAAQTGAALIPGGDDTERAAITTPAAGMFRYNDEGGFPAEMEYYDGIAWKTLSTGGGGGVVGQDWNLVSMPYPVKTIFNLQVHPVSEKFGALCLEYSGQYRLYESADGVSWTRGSYNLGTKPGDYLNAGLNNGWSVGVLPHTAGGYTGAYILPDLVTAPTLAVAPAVGPIIGRCIPSAIRAVDTTNQYVLFYSKEGAGAAMDILGFKSPDGVNWTQTYSNSIPLSIMDGRNAPAIDFAQPWAINGNVIWPTFQGAGNGGPITANIMPRSTDGGNSWTDVSFTSGNYEVYDYYNGVWTQRKGGNLPPTRLYELGTTPPASFSNPGLPNPWATTVTLSSIGLGATTSQGYYPNLAGFPGVFSGIVFPGSATGGLEWGTSAHSLAANTSISVATGPYYYISR